MLSQMYLLAVFYSLSSFTLAAAQRVDDISKVARRHRLISERETCENGAWSCAGQTLERCNHDAIIVVGECAAGTICIASGSDVGCQWPPGGPGQAPVIRLPDGSNPATATTSAYGAVPPVSTTSGVAAISFSPVHGADIDGPDGPSQLFGAPSISSSTSMGGAGLTQRPPAPPLATSSTAEVVLGATVPAISGVASSSGIGGGITTSSSAAGVAATSSGVAGGVGAALSSSGVAGGAVVSSSTAIEGGTGAATGLSSAAAAGPSNAPVPGSPPTGSFSAPHYVLYSDSSYLPVAATFPPVEQPVGVNRFVLAFFTEKGAGDNAKMWTWTPEDERKRILDAYHAAGIALMVSYGGQTVEPILLKLDPVKEATAVATYVKTYGLDGVDVDYEDFRSFTGNTGGEAWVIAFQTALRAALPKPYLISHAPVAPWFTTNTEFQGGGYMKVNEMVGDGIDFYAIQFYNQAYGDQPREPYVTCSNIFDKAQSYPGASVFEMIANGIPQEKIVVGKPLMFSRQNNRVFMEHAALGAFVKEANTKSWNGGVMFWEFDPTNPMLASQAFAAAKG